MDIFYAFYQCPIFFLGLEDAGIFLTYSSEEIEDVCGVREEGVVFNEFWRRSTLISMCRLLHCGIIRSSCLRNANGFIEELSNASLSYLRDTTIWEMHEFALTIKGNKVLSESGVYSLESPVSLTLESTLSRMFGISSIRADDNSTSRSALDFWIKKLHYDEEAYPVYIPK